MRRKLIHYSRNMESTAALETLGALSQATRLSAFRLLVRHEPDGLGAGAVAQHLGVPANTLSVHLGVLTRAGLVSFEKRGREVIYRADTGQVRDLSLFLMRDCCGGDAAACAPLIAELSNC